MKWILGIFIVCLVVLIGLGRLDLLSPPVIAKKILLYNLPLGSNKTEVLSFCAKNSLKCKQLDSSGYIDRNTKNLVGVKSIRGLLWEWRFILVTSSLLVEWGVDENEALIDFQVWSEHDSL